MQADAYLTAQFLSVVGLISATIEYCEVLRRRQLTRLADRIRAESEASGLFGLVRLFAADGSHADGSHPGD